MNRRCSYCIVLSEQKQSNMRSVWKNQSGSPSHLLSRVRKNQCHQDRLCISVSHATRVRYNTCTRHNTCTRPNTCTIHHLHNISISSFLVELSAKPGKIVLHLSVGIRLGWKDNMLGFIPTSCHPKPRPSTPKDLFDISVVLYQKEKFSELPNITLRFNVQI